MTLVKGDFRRHLVSALCALMLVLVSASHRPLQAAHTDPEIAAFLASGGSLADLCGGSHDGGSGVECPACVLSKALVELPTVDEGADRLTWVRVTRVIPPVIWRASHLPQAPPARGPPSATV
ncbi:hypothetical protein AB1M95_04195 [Sulfitobacter sp. LCG007]